ncbi:Na+/H+ antiporter [Paenibacillus doosanensis]|uniref:Na+/H+ antiporter n=1 Tax=Paenibacillus doosanensis TaxID=1229154 RepID=UPI00217F5B3C|nr:Na+/H+ antiporter [Paenibacillus doosanensis]MCS7459343.1 Na+/H+ antiporter [Paenibacillus doosanensis]
MELFLGILVLLALLGLSNVVNRIVPFVPVPLIQIALGVCVALLPAGVHIPLNPELFFVLFVAPLLFNDGKRTPLKELWKLRAPILLLAVGLVFVTVAAAGYVIHWMIPAMPLPAAFALAAILSPTDAVSVSALSARIHLPKRILRLLEGEALMNDASGLVAFKFAIAAAVTGVFSLPQAALSFMVIALGGLLLGVLLSLLIVGLQLLLRRFGMEDITVHMIIQILTPFLLYLIAEECGVSGILAAVAGGIVHAVKQELNQSVMIELQMVSTHTWSVVLFVLNGLVFVILGLQIPAVSSVIFRDAAYSNYEALGYIAVISVLLIALRFAWILAFTRGAGLFSSGKDTRILKDVPGMKSIVLTSLSGVRGTVTLAGAFSIPLALKDGSPFPERNLIIFLAAGVILFSLLVASIVLPLLTKRKEADVNMQEEENDTQIRTMTAALHAINQERTEHNAKAAAAAAGDYKKWIHQVRSEKINRKLGPGAREVETELRLAALRKERETVEEMAQNQEISPDMAQLIGQRFGQTELILANRLHLWRIMLMLLVQRIQMLIQSKADPAKAPMKLDAKEIDSLREMKIRTSEAAVDEIKRRIQDDNREVALEVISHYNHVIARIRLQKSGGYPHDERFGEQKKELHTVAVQAERDEVQKLYEQGTISRRTANKIRQYISYREALMFEQDELE